MPEMWVILLPGLRALRTTRGAAFVLVQHFLTPMGFAQPSPRAG